MAAPYLHLVAGRRAQKGDIKVEMGWLLKTASIQGASWRQPHCELQQICTGKGTAVSSIFGRLHHDSSLTGTGASDQCVAACPAECLYERITVACHTMCNARPLKGASECKAIALVKKFLKDEYIATSGTVL